MTITNTKFIAFRGKHPSRRGMALLLVLGGLALLAVMILAFLSSVKTDLQSSKFYANGSSVKTLADSTVNLVIAQIRRATAGQDSDGSPLAWASQPGMIRTYDEDGRKAKNYKLYSWDTLSTSGTFNPSEATEAVPLNWFDNQSLFVDLNRPATDANKIVHYPILDPPPTNSSSQYYVEGFSLSNAPVQSPSDNPAPMPVKWLYVLKNGEIVSPVANGSGSQVKVEGATESNPIVGRMAFWTDDETCKININTASEGVFWDTPRAQGVSDFNNATFQPSQKEYQRYPGHPATTCLSPVLGSLFPVNHSLLARNRLSVPNYNSGTATYAPYQPYYDIAPKLNKNLPTNLGSQAGTTVSTTSGSLQAKNDRLYASLDELLFKSNLVSDDTHTGSFNGTRPPTHPSITKAMLEKTKFFLTTNSRAPDVNLFDKPRIGAWPISATNSSAYRTPFDQAIAFCGQVGKTGTDIPYAYYFQRERNDHPTNDLPGSGSVTGLERNRMLIEYLQSLTSRSIPGFGGDFKSKYDTDRDQILTEIFDYIRCLNLVDRSFPSMTNPFAPIAKSPYPVKYANTMGNGNSSILSNNAGYGQVVPIYDTVNRTKGFGRFPTISEVFLIFVVSAWNDGKGGLQSDVNYPTNTSSGGFTGYNTTVCDPKTVNIQAALMLNFFDPSQGTVETFGTYSVQVLGLDGFEWGSDVANTSSMGFPSGSSNASITNMSTRDGNIKPQHSAVWGGNGGFRNFMAGEFTGKSVGNFQYYPYISAKKNFPYDPETPRNTDPNQTASPGTFYFKGGDLTIHLLLPTNTRPTWPPSSWPLSNAGSSGRPPIQTLRLSFPPATLPLPLYPPPAENNKVEQASTKVEATLPSRFGAATNKRGPNSLFIFPQDTVRSIRAYPGDIRMIAGKLSITDTQTSPSNLGPGYFDSTGNKIKNASMPNWDYFSTTQRLVHSLRESTDYPFWGALLGQLVPGITYHGQPADNKPFSDYSNGLNTFSGAGNNATHLGAFIGGDTSGMPGDWDNGFGYTADGPYINKADEGNVNSIGSGTPYFDNSTYVSEVGQTYFSPNRLMPSAGMFGSLSTGVMRNIPWQTLLFCPNPAAGPGHPGFGTGASGNGSNAQPPFTTPPDYLFLDLFNMPVVEPYPISEPLSTAGRINMNYQIVPFTYITRNTGLRAVLKSERITAIPDTTAGAYKKGDGTGFRLNTNFDYRVPVNIEETLKGFDHYFSANTDIFRSAAQICSMFLYPARDASLTSTSGPTFDSANNNILRFWNGQASGSGYAVSTSSSNPSHYLTGDNSRERPYATIYPRLTTKSNTYTAHVYVQTLKKVKGSDQSVWKEGTDVVTGEYRGSSTIERFVDPNDSTLPDFADVSINANAVLSPYYKYRIVNTTQFAQ